MFIPEIAISEITEAKMIDKEIKLEDKKEIIMKQSINTVLTRLSKRCKGDFPGTNCPIVISLINKIHPFAISLSYCICCLLDS